MKRAGLLALASIFCAVVASTAAQSEQLVEALLVPEEGASATPAELNAWAHVRMRKFIKARELADQIVEDHPDSYVGHFVLGFAHHYGEANFPRALFHHNRARALFEQQYGMNPPTSAPWKWHSRLLLELAETHGDLENYEQRLRYMATYNELYEPDVLAERAWPLMKLGRFAEARLAARQGMASGDDRQKEIALNALCAVEFEAGNDGASYEACQAALDYALSTRGAASAVDYTNFAEAARSVFRLSEAETMLLEATNAPTTWYGNPWLELGELYTRGARYPEALSALLKVQQYRAARPPHAQDSDRNESMRALSAFYLAVGRPHDALRITEKALVQPDRRSHNSRDPAQDRAVIALLDRRARLVVADMKQERAASDDWWERFLVSIGAAQLRFEAWLSGRQAARLLSDEKRFVGTFRIGTASAAIVPPWLVGELVEVAGAGVVREATRAARAEDDREGADAYYDAFAAEAALAAGDSDEAIDLATRAIEGLTPGEARLDARAQLVLALALHDERGLGDALPRYEAAYQRDPSVYRSLGAPIPVSLRVQGDQAADTLADVLERSPRLSMEAGGFVLRVDVTAAGGSVCLEGGQGSVLGCGRGTPAGDDGIDELVGRISDDFHRKVFAPRIDLSQSDIGSLDGSNLSDRASSDSILSPRDMR